jgi:hypothetical protein
VNFQVVVGETLEKRRKEQDMALVTNSYPRVEIKPLKKRDTRITEENRGTKNFHHIYISLYFLIPAWHPSLSKRGPPYSVISEPPSVNQTINTRRTQK